MLAAEELDLWDRLAGIEARRVAGKWTDERVDALKTLWAQGYSADQIAKEIGGVSRNAVIGKVHRLGLSGRVRIAKKKEPTTRVSPTQIATARRIARYPVCAGPQPKFAPVPAGRTRQSCALTELTETSCRYPNGDPGDADFYFCGQEAPGCLPYCAAHMHLCYTPAKRRAA